MGIELWVIIGLVVVLLAVAAGVVVLVVKRKARLERARLAAMAQPARGWDDPYWQAFIFKR